MYMYTYIRNEKRKGDVGRSFRSRPSIGNAENSTLLHFVSVNQSTWLSPQGDPPLPEWAGGWACGGVGWGANHPSPSTPPPQPVPCDGLHRRLEQTIGDY